MIAVLLVALSAAPPATATFELPPDLSTTWAPGIPGGVPVVQEIFTKIPAALGDGVADASAPLQEAIAAAGVAAAKTGREQVVLLPPGTFRLERGLKLDQSRVILRGAGPDKTRLRLDTGDEVAVIRVGIFWPEYRDGVIGVLADAPRGARELTVPAGKVIRAGDVLALDQEDAPYVWFADGRFRKRQPSGDVNGPGTGSAPFESREKPGGPWRSVGQQVEVTEVKAGPAGNTLVLSNPVRFDVEKKRKPQLFFTATAREGKDGVRRVGVEDLYVTGGNNGAIVLLNAAYSWVKNVEVDGRADAKLPGRYRHPAGVSGQHVNLIHAFRCEVRDSYFHHARRIEAGGGAYGISVANASSDNLVENNIAVFLNKPIVMNRSGGGNVVAYNFVDNAYGSSPGWQETAIDGNHETFSHHDLFEGNQAPNLGGDVTHGNSGWHVFFRNYAPGRNSSPPVPDGVNVRAVGVDGFTRGYAFVGNVLFDPGLEVNDVPSFYRCTTKGSCLRGAAVYRVGANVTSYEHFDDGTAMKTLYLHGNWDGLTGKVEWDPDTDGRALPDSLYRTSKPAFFGELRWPWVDPVGKVRVHELPARRRYQKIKPR